MCLGIPVKIIEIKEDNKALAELAGVKREVSLALLPDVKIGDYVLLHAGFAIQKIDEAEAEETLRLLREFVERVEP